MLTPGTYVTDALHRVRRMRGDYEGGDADPGLAPLSTGTEPQGGYAARRKRLREQEASESGDEEGTDEGEEVGLRYTFPVQRSVVCLM
jgi:hypothetical protein